MEPRAERWRTEKGSWTELGRANTTTLVDFLPWLPSAAVQETEDERAGEEETEMEEIIFSRVERKPLEGRVQRNAPVISRHTFLLVPRGLHRLRFRLDAPGNASWLSQPITPTVLDVESRSSPEPRRFSPMST